MRKKCETLRKIAKNEPNMAPRPPQHEGNYFYGGLREGLSGPHLISKNEYHTLRGPIQPRWGEDPRALFTLRESR